MSIFGGTSGATRRYRGMSESFLGGVRDVRDNYNQRAEGAWGNADATRPRTDAALFDVEKVLRRQTTDQDRGGYVADRLAPVDAAYRSGQAALTKSLQERGLSPDSSVAVSGMAGLESGRAQAVGNAANEAQDHFDAEEINNLQTLYQILYGHQMGQEQLGMGYGGNAANLGMNLAGSYQNMAQQSAAEDQANMMGAMSLITGLANPIAGMVTASQARRPTPAPGGYAGNVNDASYWRKAG